MALVKNKSNKIDEIIDYLIKHPDFFIRHPELLSSLDIPHALEDNVSSLIEYQVKNLKNEITTLKSKISEYSVEKENNRIFAKHIHRLSLQLVTSENIYQAFSSLNKQLKYLLMADKVLLYIFSDTILESELTEIKYLEKDSKIKLMFTEVFHRGKPLCGSLQEEHIKTLFGNQVTAINSTILIPVPGYSWQALFVIGSKDHNCYSHGFELDSLDYLAKIFSLVINKQF